MDEIKAKQQVVDKIKEAGKILVTVSDNPSVDALSAALGLALLLDKQEKYATAIFSGETPPAIAFLEPQKTFDDTTDSLRDFIIALNKEKADHLRYKVEGDSVKIFITPYKTTIDQNDLEYSQGDYNVELVVALGVDKQENLDKALENHGQILHDAAIVTLTAGDQTSDLGGIDWHDSDASSLSEMVANIAEALKGKDDKKKSFLDTPIATALLTGIVAETDRFSNEHTTSKVMTTAATLMAAGADQQLIANELQQAHEIVTPEVEADSTPEDDNTDADSSIDADGTMSINQDPTRLSITHENETLAELDQRVLGEKGAKDKIEDEIEAIEHEAIEEADKREKAAIILSTPTVDVFEPEVTEAAALTGLPVYEQVVQQPQEVLESAPVFTPEPALETITNAYGVDTATTNEPTFGGVLNATTDQAEDDARKAIEDDQNKTILSHAYIGDPSAQNTPNEPGGLASDDGFPGTPSETPGSVGVGSLDADEPMHSAYAPEDASAPTQTGEAPSLAVGGERVIQPLEYPQTDAPVAQPQSDFPGDLGLPLPPPIPDFSQGLAAAIPAGQPQFAPAQQPQILGDILAPEAPAPFAMDYETTNTFAAPGSAYAFDTPVDTQLGAPLPVAVDPLQPQPVPTGVYGAPEPPAVQAPAPQTPPNPGQFQIPGQ